MTYKKFIHSYKSILPLSDTIIMETEIRGSAYVRD